MATEMVPGTRPMKNSRLGFIHPGLTLQTIPSHDWWTFFYPNELEVPLAPPCESQAPQLRSQPRATSRYLLSDVRRAISTFRHGFSDTLTGRWRLEKIHRCKSWFTKGVWWDDMGWTSIVHGTYQAPFWTGLPQGLPGYWTCRGVFPQNLSMAKKGARPMDDHPYCSK